MREWVKYTLSSDKWETHEESIPASRVFDVAFLPQV